MKKLISLVLALCMVLTIGAAFAAEGDTTLTVTGLEGATSVKYYKIIDWDDTNGWKWAAPYSSNTTTFTADLLKEITGDPGDPANNVPAVAGKITPATANTIAAEANTLAINGGSLANGTWTATVAKENRGMYMVVPTGSGDVLFNPIFISANHGKTTQTVDVSSNYDGEGMVKKSTINLDKKTDKHTFQGFEGLKWDANSAQPGDTITFWVETTIPKFASSYTNPVFAVSDSVSTGMNIQTDSLKVYKGTKESVGANLTKGDATPTGDYDVNFTTANGVTSAFVLNFHNSFFTTMTANQQVVIEYKAKVTNAATLTVNEENNTVRIDFSNGPDDEQGHKHDKTRHWTFSIDAHVLGNEEYHTSELLKIGVKPDGTPDIVTHKYDNNTETHPLAGATFQLKKGSTVIREVTTEDLGYIHFEGLDVGTYTLVETQAPAGYVKDNTEYTVTITADITENGFTETLSDGCEVQVDKLNSYHVKVKNSEGVEVDSSYTFDNGTLIQYTDNGDISTLIANTPGAELPSTGGIGTTIFYIVGGILLIGAAVILVARRKAQD